MEAWFLREWQRTSPWQILLRPVSWVFALLAGVRRWLYRSGWLERERIDVPVIVVGNITVGGTGKTPLVLALASLLARGGYHPGIVTRGYRRGRQADAERFIIHVVPASSGEPASDEATLLANRSGVPVYAGAYRPDVARILLKANAGVDVIISDDGLQHHALQRDLEICVIDGERGLGNGALLPAGPLREPRSRLFAVDAIVVNGGDTGAFQLPSVPVFQMALANELFIPVMGGREMSTTEWNTKFAGKKIVAVAGTGNPARFFTHIKTLGVDAGETRAFPDHYPFTAGDFAAMTADVILMTEKDAVKCRVFADDRMWFMRVDAVLPDAFGQLVLTRLSRLKV
ncbi:MAG: tetraacyldisaccharide 4'-kinase [Betaproteobacteria bacterium]|nr:tetraacyldisaccharide 4'-kinase [Betaproteobacteria bacterium]